ncbi:hypothetical protein B296_00002330 [Ensete ventricosum]|uniref:Uncharacterized protein n=1 Tax=Ensete ventricosum TaxID=4639 RepID=A0A427A604_ENSVE|nr:hypothetical protein B296_00002330 [Ensete ventricosum]
MHFEGGRDFYSFLIKILSSIVSTSRSILAVWLLGNTSAITAGVNGGFGVMFGSYLWPMSAKYIGSWESLVTAVSSRKLAMASTSLVFTVLVGPHKRYPLFQASSYLELEQSVLPEHTDSRSNIDSFHQNKYVHSG